MTETIYASPSASEDWDSRGEEARITLIRKVTCAVCGGDAPAGAEVVGLTKHPLMRSSEPRHIYTMDLNPILLRKYVIFCPFCGEALVTEALPSQEIARCDRDRNEVIQRANEYLETEAEVRRHTLDQTNEVYQYTERFGDKPKRVLWLMVLIEITVLVGVFAIKLFVGGLE